MTQRVSTLVLVAGLIALALAGGLFMSATKGEDRVTAAETDTTRTISVSGEGRVSLAPDIVMMTLGVDMRDPDLGAAQQRAATTMDSVLAALRANGVDEKDIQTAGYYISVERDYNQQTQPIIGYIVSHSVTVKVRQLDNAGTVLQAAIDAGANSVQGVWFALENPGNAIKQAREQAVADARARAEELARLTNSSLGPVQSISEGYTPSTPPVPFAGDTAAERSAAAPTINPGQTEVVVTVNVVYAIN